MKSERGNSMIEFVLCMTFLIPLLLGSMSIGIDLGRSLMASQVVRDTGHMYARSTDFSLQGSKDLIAHISRSLGMTASGGDGVVILSKVLKAGDAQCTAGGVAVASCSNRGKAVVTQRIVIGNATFGSSAFATPTASLITSNGDITPDNYLKSISVVTNGFTNLLNMADGDEAYVVEGWFKSTDLLRPPSAIHKIYTRSIF